MRSMHLRRACASAQAWPSLRRSLPGPGVAEPERRQHVQACAASGPRLATVMRIRMSSGVRLRVLDEDVEVAVLVEDPVSSSSNSGSCLPRGGSHRKLLIRKLRLRILVQGLHVRVRRRGVEVEVALLHIFAVVALGAGEAEQAFLEDRVLPFHSARAKQIAVRSEMPGSRPRPSDTRGSGHDHAGSIPRQSPLAV